MTKTQSEKKNFPEKKNLNMIFARFLGSYIFRFLLTFVRKCTVKILKLPSSQRIQTEVTQASSRSLGPS